MADEKTDARVDTVQTNFRTIEPRTFTFQSINQVNEYPAEQMRPLLKACARADIREVPRPSPRFNSRARKVFTLFSRMMGRVALAVYDLYTPHWRCDVMSDQKGSRGERKGGASF